MQDIGATHILRGQRSVTSRYVQYSTDETRRHISEREKIDVFGSYPMQIEFVVYLRHSHRLIGYSILFAAVITRGTGGAKVTS